MSMPWFFTPNHSLFIFKQYVRLNNNDQSLIFDAEKGLQVTFFFIFYSTSRNIRDLSRGIHARKGKLASSLNTRVFSRGIHPRKRNRTGGQILYFQSGSVSTCLSRSSPVSSILPEDARQASNSVLSFVLSRRISTEDPSSPSGIPRKVSIFLRA